jgi:16S rRNA (guanine527-N7)-methyltransferase
MTLAYQLADGLAAMGLSLPSEGQARLIAYVRLIEKWNRIHNLTAVRDPEKMVALHLLDSLSVLPHLAGMRTLLDVGTGAGLPGIPIAIARPDLQMTLLDSSHKKIAFLQHAKTELALTNCEIVCERVETWKPGRQFDGIVTRAFSDLCDFVTQAGHLAAPAGEMLAMKGVHPFEEIATLPKSHRVENVYELKVPSLDAKRHLILMKAA